MLLHHVTRFDYLKRCEGKSKLAAEEQLASYPGSWGGGVRGKKESLVPTVRTCSRFL